MRDERHVAGELGELLEERRAIAERAAVLMPGEWHHFGTGDGDGFSADDDRGTWIMPLDGVPCEEHIRFCYGIASHIAANDPQTVTLMLDVIAAAERRQQAEDALEARIAGHGPRGWETNHEYAEWFRAHDAIAAAKIAVRESLAALEAHLRGNAETTP